MIESRRSKIHPIIDGQKVISHRARQRVILHGGGMSAIARGWQWPVRVTTILPCRLVTAIPSLPPPKPPPYHRGRRHCRPERTFTGNATCALCVEKMWEMCVRVYNAFGSTGMWGSGALFVRAFFISNFFQRKINGYYDNRPINIITKSVK